MLNYRFRNSHTLESREVHAMAELNLLKHERDDNNNNNHKNTIVANNNKKQNKVLYLLL